MTFVLTTYLLLTKCFTTEIPGLTSYWYEINGLSLVFNIFVLNLIPYLFMLIIDCKCCCRKSARSNKGVFKAEDNYLRRVTTIFIVFCFGFGMPLLILLCFIPFVLTLIIDELLVIYWLKPTVISRKMVEGFMDYTMALAFTLFILTRVTIESIYS